jgi:hypothetical protein
VGGRHAGKNDTPAEDAGGNGSKEAWSLNKVLPEKHGIGLEGAYLASNITGPYNYLIFQSHDSQIVQYKGSLEKWDG